MGRKKVLKTIIKEIGVANLMADIPSTNKKFNAAIHSYSDTKEGAHLTKEQRDKWMLSVHRARLAACKASEAAFIEAFEDRWAVEEGRLRKHKILN